MQHPRVRFAPSPTGALHIGGVRTALYNYLLAKQQGGKFLLRIEDTDQNRYVPGAEAYIIESLKWCGLIPDEGPGFGGEFGPYRQSERKHIYKEYAEQLVKNGYAYYAFDTEEALQQKRVEFEAAGKTFKYDASVREEMDTSLTLSPDELQKRLESDFPYTIRLKVPAGETVTVHDQIRGAVTFQTSELDDKVMLKNDGMPTYHLANIVDDHLMQITHVIRGEEWLPSTAHHLLLYRFLGWEDTMPQFAHLPLILKPNGKGKLSKRDGAKLGIPVFPISWEGEVEEDSFVGFREFGFLPEAVLNFLAFLGWNPGTEQEIFSLEGLQDVFTLDKISKSGARFDFDKAKWYNQQYIIASSNARLAEVVRPLIEAKGHKPDAAYLERFCGLLKERVTLLPEFWEQGYYFFEEVVEYDEKTVNKKWTTELRPKFENFKNFLKKIEPFDAATLEAETKAFLDAEALKFGDILPIFRIAISGTTKGPGVFEMAELLGKEKVVKRFEESYVYFDKLVSGS